MTRVFDICHGCRRCFNLCESFPRLFDLIDEGPTGELDGVKREDFAKVDEACTLCDMCFMTKCPYVPPHPFDLDFPHLIVRYRAAKRRAGERDFVRDQLGHTDRNGKLAKPVAGLANWATARKNTPLRKLMDAIAGIDAEVELPQYPFQDRCHRPPALAARGQPRRPRLRPAQGGALRHLFRRIQQARHRRGRRQGAGPAGGRGPAEVYPECCGMPQMEAGDLADVAARAERVAAAFAPWIDDGYEVVALTASCGLMMKFEWPLMLPENAAVAQPRRRHQGHQRVHGRPVARLRPGPGPAADRGRRHHPPRLPRPGPEHGRQVGRDAAA